MNILQIHNNADMRASGTAVAMLLLHSGLLQYDISSRIIAVKSNRNNDDTALIPTFASPRMRSLDRRLNRFAERQGLNFLASFRSLLIERMEHYTAADLLHFHTIHTRAFSYMALPHLTKDKPAVYTLHDMWPLTGHCAQSFGCERWKIGCGRCPHPKVNPPIRKDNTRTEWKLKKLAFGRSDLTFVAPSKWLGQMVPQSLLRGKPIYHIPNGIDTSILRPRNQKASRRLLGIPQDKCVIMSGVGSFNWEKGADLLVEAIRLIPRTLKRNIVLILIGRYVKELAASVDVETMDFGFVEDDHQKALLLSASDVFAYPSRAENHPLMLLETLSCGVPSVAFSVGGVPEIVSDGETGMLAEPENAKDFSDKIVQLIEDRGARERLGQESRRKALREYDHTTYVWRYITLYRRILGIERSVEEEVRAASYNLSLDEVAPLAATDS